VEQIQQKVTLVKNDLTVENSPDLKAVFRYLIMLSTARFINPHTIIVFNYKKEPSKSEDRS
jgi:hypothetical protein